MKIASMRRVLLGTALLIASTAIVMGAFTQSFNFPFQATASNCASASPTSVPAPGFAGTLLFNCGSGNAAFTVFTAGNYAPSFTLVTGLTAVAIVDHGTACTSSTPITNGSPMALTINSFDYCLTFSSYPSTSPAFSVSWNP